MIFSNLLRRALARKFRISYAQLAEDILIQQLLKRQIRSYVDIGANHPAFGNNSYYFYLRGAQGICVDPNVSFVPLYRKWRPKDVFLRSAVSNSSRPTLSFIMEGGHTDWSASATTPAANVPSIEVPNIHVNDLLSRVDAAVIDLLSIDVELSTAETTEAIDFTRFSVAAVCVEISGCQQTEERIIGCLEAHGFELAAVNPVNAIFINPSVR